MGWGSLASPDLGQGKCTDRGDSSRLCPSPRGKMLDLGLPRHPRRVPPALISGLCAHCTLTCSASELIQAPM